MSSMAKESLASTRRFLLLLLVWISWKDTAVCSASIGSWGKEQRQNEQERQEQAEGTTSTKPTTSNSINSNNNNNNVDHRTYLDLFGESAKEFLTQTALAKLKTILPETDPACDWDWKTLRCEPYCKCSFQPKWLWLLGDVHLGRACRNRKQPEGFADEFCSTTQPPPPPSILPFLAKHSKTAVERVRTTTDPVVAKAVQNVDLLHTRVRSVVCLDISNRCSEPITEGTTPIEPTTTERFAWQERLFCGDMVRNCKAVERNHQEPDTNERDINPR